MPGIRVANAPCSWGVLEFGLDSEPMSYSQVLDEMATAGFAGTELGDWGFMPSDPAALRGELEGRGLALLAAFVPAALARPETLKAGIQTALETARLLAAVNSDCKIVLADENGSENERTRCAGRIEAHQGLDDAGWDAFARGAEAVARAVREETGLATVFHHHCAGWVETPEETLALMERTDPALLGLCLDTGHWTYGGGNPLSALERFGDRIWHVHFKDCHAGVAQRAREQGLDYFQAVREGVFCELGQGEVDFQAMTEALRGRGYSGWIVVEQDVIGDMGTPLESACRNRAYLRTLDL